MKRDHPNTWEAAVRVVKTLVVVTLVSIIMGGISLPTGAAATVIDVRPGESIQAAIDAAHAGDTISVHKGVFREFIVIDKSITLVGRRGTAIKPPPSGSGLCGFRNAGICVWDGDDIVPDVTLRNLRVAGFAGDGVLVYKGINLAVEHVRSEDNAGIGINAVDSPDSKFHGNVALHNGSHGLAMENIGGLSDNEMIGNLSVGNGGRGAFVNHDNFVAVQRNKFLANCGGILVQDSPTADVSRNKVLRPGQACSTSTGIELVDTTDSVVSNNVVRGHQANGISLVTSTGATVDGNVARRNTPLDLFWDGNGTNTFTDNRCGTSSQPGLCT